MARIKWALGGKPTTPQKIAAEIRDAYSETIAQTVSAIVGQTEDLLKRLDDRSTRRGRGFYAVRYNNPFDGAEVVVDEVVPDEKYLIYVEDEGRGSPGYKFNVLNSGIPARATASPMVFPVYSGNLTKAGTNSTTLNRAGVRVEDEPRFVSVNKVRAAKARNFYNDIIKKAQSRSRRRSRGRFRFVVDPNDVSLKVVDR